MNEIFKKPVIGIKIGKRKFYKKKWCSNISGDIRLDAVCNNPYKELWCSSICDNVIRERKRKEQCKKLKYYSLLEDNEVPLIIETVVCNITKIFCPSCRGGGKKVTRVDAFLGKDYNDLPICPICDGKGKLEGPTNAKQCHNCGCIQYEYNTQCWMCKQKFKINLSKIGKYIYAKNLSKKKD